MQNTKLNIKLSIGMPGLSDKALKKWMKQKNIKTWDDYVKYVITQLLPKLERRERVKEHIQKEITEMVLNS